MKQNVFASKGCKPLEFLHQEKLFFALGLRIGLGNDEICTIKSINTLAIHYQRQVRKIPHGTVGERDFGMCQSIDTLTGNQTRAIANRRKTVCFQVCVNDERRFACLKFFATRGGIARGSTDKAILSGVLTRRNLHTRVQEIIRAADIFAKK